MKAVGPPRSKKINKRKRKQIICTEAAMYFAEIGSIPQKFLDLPAKNKCDAVKRRNWKLHFRNWTSFINAIQKQEPELCKLALEVKPEAKSDPLATLRASTTEK